MARHVRVEFEGAIYHVTMRVVGEPGDKGAVLFRDDIDRLRFLKCLEERVEQYEIRLYVYCLMPNHVHLVLETPRGNLSAFMQSLGTAYTVYFNIRHNRRGHLFQGRYKAKLVDGDAYLLSLSRYVHLNPVHTKGWKRRPVEERLQALRTYRWSSLREYAGWCRPSGFVDRGPVLAYCDRDPRKQKRAYRRYVQASLAEEDGELLEVLASSSLGIGDEEFLDAMRARYIDAGRRYKRRDDVSLRKVAVTLPPERVLQIAAAELGVEVDDFRQRRRGGILRGIGALLLRRYAGLSQRDSAALLGVASGSGLGRQESKVKALRQHDRRLSRQLKQIETILDPNRPGKC